MMNPKNLHPDKDQENMAGRLSYFPNEEDSEIKT